MTPTPREALKSLIDYLLNESEAKFAQAHSRRPKASERNMTAKELRDAKRMAEQMTGRKLDLVSTSVADNIAHCDMQDRIADKLEKEARQLDTWAKLLQNFESSEPLGKE